MLINIVRFPSIQTINNDKGILYSNPQFIKITVQMIFQSSQDSRPPNPKSPLMIKIFFLTKYFYPY